MVHQSNTKVKRGIINTPSSGIVSAVSEFLPEYQYPKHILILATQIQSSLHSN